MDLNHLYSQHQIALMNAGAALDLPVRRQYLDSASDIACRIGRYQQTKGAEAAFSWLGDREPRLHPVAAGASPKELRLD